MKNLSIKKTYNYLLNQFQRWQIDRDSNNIQVFAVNVETGLLEDTGKVILLEKPVCLKWLRR
jgi:6-phosphogluconolactonase (cycloisomerase 2 family)